MRSSLAAAAAASLVAALAPTGSAAADTTLEDVTGSYAFANDLDEGYTTIVPDYQMCRWVGTLAIDATGVVTARRTMRFDSHDPHVTGPVPTWSTLEQTATGSLTLRPDGTAIGSLTWSPPLPRHHHDRYAWLQRDPVESFELAFHAAGARGVLEVVVHRHLELPPPNDQNNGTITNGWAPQGVMLWRQDSPCGPPPVFARRPGVELRPSN